MALEIARPLVDEASGGAASASVEWDPDHAGQQPRTRGRALGWLLLVGIIVALWPAAWGGLTGIAVINEDSMQPGYGTHDVVLTLRQSSYMVGDVVSFKVPADQGDAGRRVIHRIVAVDEAGGKPVFTTQGDSNSSADPWKISAGDVVGKAVLRVPRIGVAFNDSSGLLLGTLALSVPVVVVPSKSRTSAEKPTVTSPGI